jgi:hypothetical protein
MNHLIEASRLESEADDLFTTAAMYLNAKVISKNDFNNRRIEAVRLYLKALALKGDLITKESS